MQDVGKGTCEVTFLPPMLWLPTTPFPPFFLFAKIETTLGFNFALANSLTCGGIDSMFTLRLAPAFWVLAQTIAPDPRFPQFTRKKTRKEK